MKKWYQSKGVWGGLVTLITVVLSVLGYSLAPESQEALVTALTAIGSGIGGVLAVYGRVKAEGKIGR